MLQRSSEESSCAFLFTQMKVWMLCFHLPFMSALHFICVCQWFETLSSKNGWKSRDCTPSPVLCLTPKEHTGVCSHVKLLSVPLELLLWEMIMTNPPFICTAWCLLCNMGNLPVLVDSFIVRMEGVCCTVCLIGLFIWLLKWYYLLLSALLSHCNTGSSRTFLGSRHCSSQCYKNIIL